MAILLALVQNPQDSMYPERKITQRIMIEALVGMTMDGIVQTLSKAGLEPKKYPAQTYDTWTTKGENTTFVSHTLSVLPTPAGAVREIIYSTRGAIPELVGKPPIMYQNMPLGTPFEKARDILNKLAKGSPVTFTPTDAAELGQADYVWSVKWAISAQATVEISRTKSCGATKIHYVMSPAPKKR